MLYLCVRDVMDVVFSVCICLLMLVEDARGDYLEEEYSRAGLMTAL